MSNLRTLASLGLLIALGGCDKTTTEAAKPVVRPVLSMKVEQASASGLTLAGSIQPRVQTSFAFRVLGRVIARPVNTGDVVAKGQTLAAIDPVALKFAAQSAEAELSSGEAQLTNAIGVEDRQSQLLKSNATTQAQLDTAQQALAAAQATTTRARAALVKAREQLSYAVLKSDFAGVVTSVAAEVGQTVSPGQTVVEVAEPDLRDAVIDIPEAYASALKIGERFNVAPQLDPAINVSGAIREIAPEADSATRTRRVKIALEDPPSAVRLGSTITARLATPETQGFRLPSSALLVKDGQDFVWIVDPKSATVSTRRVTLARNEPDFIEVSGGLEPDMRVVTAGAHSLAEGHAVRLDAEATP
jgi:RND family efflux transporter MFP subunit